MMRLLSLQNEGLELVKKSFSRVSVSLGGIWGKRGRGEILEKKE